MPEIDQSKNANTGEISEIGGSVIFGDGNYHYQGDTIIIQGGMTKNAWNSVQNELKQCPHIFKTFSEENPIYQKFLWLDRSEIASRVREECEEKGCRFFYWRTDNRHQPDWLFDRVRAELNKTEAANYQSHKIDLLENVSFKSAMREIKNRFNLDSPPQNAAQLLKALDGQGTQSATHLVLFLIDVTEGTTQHSKLEEFEKDFFDFWGSAPSDTNFKVFLAVKLRQSNTLMARLKRMVKFEKPHWSENVNFIKQLAFISKHDIDRFFEYSLRANNVKVKIKKPLYISDVWSELVPEIYHQTEHGKTE